MPKFADRQYCLLAIVYLFEAIKNIYVIFLKEPTLLIFVAYERRPYR